MDATNGIATHLHSRDNQYRLEAERTSHAYYRNRYIDGRADLAANHEAVELLADFTRPRAERKSLDIIQGHGRSNLRLVGRRIY